MATFTTPVDFTTGELPTAARLNAQLMANVRNLINPPMCRVTHSATQAMTDNTLTVVSFNTETGLFDTDTMHDPVTNSRITVKTAGVYLFGFNGSIAAAGDYVSGRAALKLNGTTFIATGNEIGTYTDTGHDPDIMVMTPWKCAVNDYVEVFIQQNNTANVSRNLLNTTSYSPMFWAVWVGTG